MISGWLLHTAVITFIPQGYIQGVSSITVNKIKTRQNMKLDHNYEVVPGTQSEVFCVQF
jgi:hypothetical protein